MLVGVVCTVLDLSILLTGVELLGLPRVPCVLAGVTVGSAVGFVLNKYFAFRDTSQRLGTQALKYAALMIFELSLHSGLVSALVHGANLHYLPAKFGADFLVFSCLHLLAMRYLVFVRPASVTAPAPELATRESRPA